MRKVIKDKTGLEPDRIKGSHMIYKDPHSGGIAVVPRRSGGKHWKAGTNKSMERQFRRFNYTI